MDKDRKLADLAQRLDDAALHARPIEQVAEEIDTADAYAIQRLSIGRRIARGEKSIGIKTGHQQGRHGAGHELGASHRGHDRRER